MKEFQVDFSLNGDEFCAVGVFDTVPDVIHGGAIVGGIIKEYEVPTERVGEIKIDKIYWKDNEEYFPKGAEISVMRDIIIAGVYDYFEKAF